MNPQATWDRLLAAYAAGDWDAIEQNATSLKEWLDRGGQFLPPPLMGEGWGGGPAATTSAPIGTAPWPRPDAGSPWKPCTAVGNSLFPPHMASGVCKRPGNIVMDIRDLSTVERTTSRTIEARPAWIGSASNCSGPISNRTCWL